MRCASGASPPGSEVPAKLVDDSGCIPYTIAAFIVDACNSFHALTAERNALVRKLNEVAIERDQYRAAVATERGAWQRATGCAHAGTISDVLARIVSDLSVAVGSDKIPTSQIEAITKMAAKLAAERRGAEDQ